MWLECAFICAITAFIRPEHRRSLEHLITLVPEAFTLFLKGKSTPGE